jgi:hypothetical protein
MEIEYRMVASRRRGEKVDQWVLSCHEVGTRSPSMLLHSRVTTDNNPVPYSSKGRRKDIDYFPHKQGVSVRGDRCKRSNLIPQGTHASKHHMVPH